MKTASPLISIITVVYNCSNTLEETILSVINQDFDNFEYIIIDGASTDGSTEIIKKYQDKITYWISEPDKGIYDAMNKGIKLSKGEWSYFMNAGDSFYDSKLLSNIKNLLEDSVYDVVVGKVKIYNNINNSFGYFPEFDANFINYNPRYLFNTHLCHQAIFVKTLSYKHVDSFNLDYKVFSDFNSVFSIIKIANGFKKIDLVIANYNLDGVSANYKNAIKLFFESEIILKKCGDKSSLFMYCIRLIRTILYFIKSSVINYIQ
jgi:glycosyltransferase involved in cell wall biosynthesis